MTVEEEIVIEPIICPFIKDLECEVGPTIYEYCKCCLLGRLINELSIFRGTQS